MAISSFNVYLKWGATKGALTEKTPIKDFPDLFGDPNLLETTTLRDGAQTYIPGIKSTDMLQFTINYDKEVFASCKDDEGKVLYYELGFSDGSKFTWQGSHTMGLPGKGVDEVIDATVNVVPSTVIEYDAGTTTE